MNGLPDGTGTHEPRENIMDMTKGQTYTVTTDKGTVTGEYISTNTKGVNLKVDGKVISRSLKSITNVSVPDAPGGDLTTAELASLFHMEAKALRVELRKLGLGVGKGRKYTFGPADVVKVRAHLAEVAGVS